MKEAELRSLASCACCHNKLGECGSPLFFKVTVERFAVDGQAIQRQTGLELLLGKAAFISQAMGPDEDMALPIADARSVMVCTNCSMQTIDAMKIFYRE